MPSITHFRNSGSYVITKILSLTKNVYLSRSVKPKSMLAAVLHDHLSHSTFSNLLQISALTDEKWKQATLPIWWFRLDIITRNIKLDFCVLMDSFCARAAKTFRSFRTSD